MNASAAAKNTIKEGYQGTDLRALSDAELARRALTNDGDTWAELTRRFEPVLRKEIGRTLAAGKKLLSSDASCVSTCPPRGTSPIAALTPLCTPTWERRLFNQAIECARAIR